MKRRWPDGVTVGQYCTVEEGVVFQGACKVGNYVTLRDGAILGDGCQVADYATVEAGAMLAIGVRMWHYARVREGARVGEHVSVGERAHIGPGVVIGNGTRIGNGAQLHHPAVIGLSVFVGPDVFMSNDPYPGIGGDFTPRPVIVHDHAILGCKCAIRGGVTVYHGGVVGMGSTCISDVGRGEIVCGCPARVKKHRAQHWPGTSIEHWAPLDPDGECVWCKGFDLHPPKEVVLT